MDNCFICTLEKSIIDCHWQGQRHQSNPFCYWSQVDSRWFSNPPWLGIGCDGNIYSCSVEVKTSMLRRPCTSYCFRFIESAEFVSRFTKKDAHTVSLVHAVRAVSLSSLFSSAVTSKIKKQSDDEIIWIPLLH